MDSKADILDRQGKAAEVRAMFSEIAPRYDFLNHALSLNVDKRWRRFVIKKVQQQLSRPGAVAVDLCCGTADLAIELGEIAPTVGIDFCRPMLKVGQGKLRNANLPIELVEGDALNVPVRDGSVDVVTVAFGLRNLESVEAGLKEIYRLLRPGGRAAVLEFSRPQLPIFSSVFQFYFTKILPRIGNAISGSRFAYQYLPESVMRFPDQQALARMMQSFGFSDVRYYNLFGGVAALHIGDKP
ncbi:MAG TPA: bifunctional demethylmenaquinone methyltransferase/2-methoxy-6-polyprenyl-1,4-benzoquinol methylase UbiE [Blastocatellia bacterium]|nr:bifunctional demethylmenaquinone methyltransferase/2-methoxy-6-polyprenyl-1,4-benzoquinol methylase UbiE [Blastocatellia bacterium]